MKFILLLLKYLDFCAYYHLSIIAAISYNKYIYLLKRIDYHYLRIIQKIHVYVYDRLSTKRNDTAFTKRNDTEFKKRNDTEFIKRNDTALERKKLQLV